MNFLTFSPMFGMECARDRGPFEAVAVAVMVVGVEVCDVAPVVEAKTLVDGGGTCTFDG